MISPSRPSFDAIASMYRPLRLICMSDQPSACSLCRTCWLFTGLSPSIKARPLPGCIVAKAMLIVPTTNTEFQ